MTLHKAFRIPSLQPAKFAPLPAIFVTNSKGNRMLAIDRGYGFEGPEDLSKESSHYLTENTRGEVGPK